MSVWDDQASRLRRLVGATRPTKVDLEHRLLLSAMTIPSSVHGHIDAARVAPVVAIASGKGGVGKTNLSVNLSIALSQMGLRVTLVDADLGMANADVLCGLLPSVRLDAAVAERERLGSIAIEAPGGFRLVPGAVGVAQMAELSSRERGVIVDGLADLDASSDVVIVDTAAGAGSGVIGFLNAADLAVVVTTPEPTAITDAYGLIKCLVQSYPQQRGCDADFDLRPQVRLVVNQALNGAEAEAVFRRVDGVTARFLQTNVELLGFMTTDLSVQLAVRERRPFMLHRPDCEASLCVARIAAQLSRALGLEANVPRAPRRGVLSALSGWFSRDDRAVRADRAGALG